MLLVGGSAAEARLPVGSHWVFGSQGLLVCQEFGEATCELLDDQELAELLPPTGEKQGLEVDDSMVLFCSPHMLWMVGRVESGREEERPNSFQVSWGGPSAGTHGRTSTLRHSRQHSSPAAFQ